MTAKVNRTMKDSMFKLIFREPSNRVQLIRGLCGEDYAREPSRVVTLTQLYSSGIENDLGIQVGDRMLLLAEAQSTVPTNIALRFLSYMTNTVEGYVTSTYPTRSIYGVRRLQIPAPVMYAIYTGRDVSNIPKVYNLADHFPANSKIAVNLRVAVLNRSNVLPESVIGKYIQFCDICDKARELYGINDMSSYCAYVIKQCTAKDIFVQIIQEHFEEVKDMLSYEEQVRRNIEWYARDYAEVYAEEHAEEYAKPYIEKAVKEATEKATKEATAKTAEETEINVLNKMSKALGISVEELRNRLKKADDESGDSARGSGSLSQLNLG